MTSTSYAQSGVDIEAGNRTISLIKEGVNATHSKHVLNKIGAFAALFDIKEASQGYKHPILVQSIDGVGTKLIIAEMLDSFASVGEDIVNHSCNDIVVLGAKPLTFLDYIANEKLNPEHVSEMVGGMVKACKEAGLSLVGGETAEMPGTYISGKHDIAGCITGIVEKDQIITGKSIKPGDIVFGLGSSGLHTNGYSLARKVLFDIAKLSADSVIPELNCEQGSKTLGEHLLAVHINYTKPILKLIDSGVNIAGLAHITGGGFIDNIPRVLPEGVDTEIKIGSWEIPPIFKLIQTLGKVEDQEIYRVLNMGIGMVIIVDPSECNNVQTLMATMPEYKLFEIGQIIKGKREVVLN